VGMSKGTDHAYGSAVDCRGAQTQSARLELSITRKNLDPLRCTQIQSQPATNTSTRKKFQAKIAPTPSTSTGSAGRHGTWIDLDQTNGRPMVPRYPPVGTGAGG
jgi:hypothetical protein